VTIIAGVETHLPRYLLARATRVLDAWGPLAPDGRPDLDDALRDAAAVATTRVAAELRALVATDPAAQRSTPLELVRTAVREPSLVLAGAGVPDVVRDEFDARSFPDDRYGLSPRTFSDLDDALGPVQLVWGIAKAAALRVPGADGPL
jgi:hypothetical protein